MNKMHLDVRDDTVYCDNDFVCYKNVKTNYVISSKGEVPREFYTVEAVLFLLENVALVHSDYCRLANSSNVPAIRRPDRKGLLKYLTGEADTYPSRNLFARKAEVSASAAAAVASLSSSALPVVKQEPVETVLSPVGPKGIKNYHEEPPAGFLKAKRVKTEEKA